MSATHLSTNVYMYKSYWGHQTNAPRYIVEQVYLNVCKWKKLEPVAKFWNLPEWSKFYRLQIILANELIKLYSESSVVNGIKHFKPCTLRNIELDKVIEKFYKAELTKPKEVEQFGVPKTNSLRDRLKEL